MVHNGQITFRTCWLSLLWLDDTSPRLRYTARSWRDRIYRKRGVALEFMHQRCSTVSPGKTVIAHMADLVKICRGGIGLGRLTL